MPATRPPQYQLDLQAFPTNDDGSPAPMTQEIAKLNTHSQQLTAYLSAQPDPPQYRTQPITTGADATKAFPINLALPKVPNEIRVARPLAGTLDTSVSAFVHFVPLSSGGVQITNITGLLPNQRYQLLLVLT